MAFLALHFVPTVLAFVVAGPDVEKATSLVAAAVKKRKKGVYRPKIQVDVVFKRSTPAAAKKAAAAPKKRYTRKKKAEKDGLALGGEDSLVVGVAGCEDDGAGGSCMEGVVLAGERSVHFPEIGVGVGGRMVEGGGVEVEKKVGEERVEVNKKVGEERVEVNKKVGEEGVEMVKVEEVGMEEDGTPPPKPMAMERRLTRTYLRRNGLNAKRCLDFGLGKSDDQVLPVAEGEVIAVAEARVGEVIVEEEEEAMVPSLRKPRTKRARTKQVGLVKLNYTNPGEWSSLLSKNKIFTESGGRGSGNNVKSGGRGSGKALGNDLLLHFNVVKKQMTLKGKWRNMSRVAAVVFAKLLAMTISLPVCLKNKGLKRKPKDMNKGLLDWLMLYSSRVVNKVFFPLILTSIPLV